MLAKGERKDPSDRAERARLLKIYQSWRTGQNDRARVTWCRRLNPSTATFVVLLLSTVALIPLDEALWSLKEGATGFPIGRLLQPQKGIYAAALAFWLLSAILVDRTLRREKAAALQVRTWLLALRFLLGGMPIVSVYLVPAWRWICENRPAWAVADSRSPAAAVGIPSRPEALNFLGTRFRLGWQRLWRWMESLPVLLGIWTGGTFLFLSMLSGLAGLLDRSVAGRRTLWVIVAAVHLALGVMALAYSLREADSQHASRPRSITMALTCLLWLPPVPYVSLLGLALLFSIEPEAEQSQGVIHRALFRRQEASRLPLWLSLEKNLQRGWKDLPWWLRWRRQPGRALAQPDEAAEAERKILRLYDLKSLLLMADAFAIAWAAETLAGQSLFGTCLLRGSLVLMILASFVAGSLGLLFFMLRRFQAAFHASRRLEPLDHHPYARYLARTQLCFLAFSLFGVALQRGYTRESISLLGLAAGLYWALHCFGMLTPYLLPSTRARAEMRDLGFWIGSFLLAYAALLCLAVFATLRVAWIPLCLWLILSPFVGAALARRYLPWLLRPFERADFLSPRLPFQLRTVLALLWLTAILPLGGLAIPLWIFARQRILPRAAALAWNRSSALRHVPC